MYTYLFGLKIGSENGLFKRMHTFIGIVSYHYIKYIHKSYQGLMIIIIICCLD